MAAIKIAPFNRYQTLDVVRAVCESSRREEIALYTGNDDNIVADLLAPYDLVVEGRPVRKWIVGGLLGQWAVWTSRAVEIIERARRLREPATYGERAGDQELRETASSGEGKDEREALRERASTGEGGGQGEELRELLSLGVRLTDANAAVFDAANGFAGVIAGVHEVLRGQGLLEGTWCLDPDERLSPGQREEIGRVRRAYPELTDDEFVSARLDDWLAAAPRLPSD